MVIRTVLCPVSFKAGRCLFGFRVLTKGAKKTMNTAKTLFNMREGTSAIVSKLLNEGGMRRRLQDIGLIEGTSVLCLQRSPAGDPIAYLVRGAVIALREEDSSKVLVE